MTTKPLQNGSVVLKTINLRKKEHFSKSPWLSDELLESVTQALNNKRQSLIFLNRRGTARLTLCQNCGWQRLCTRCDLPMTFHGDNYSLVCHTCGQTALVPTSCPTCDSTNIIFKSIGTKTIDSEITKLFPNARIQRFDSDIENSERFEHYYKAAKAGEIDILIGTQMLSKGLDLPKLEVVGVVLADTGLYFPDFSASEATYQMITQVIGRVGRGHGMSKVIVQTYDDENAVIRFATTNDYLGFYKSELEERKQYGFPPYYHLLKVSCSYKTAKHAEKTMTDFAVKITDAYPRIKLIGPAPAFIERSHDQYHWQLTLASKDRSALLQILRELPGQFNYDMDPNNLL